MSVDMAKYRTTALSLADIRKELPKVINEIAVREEQRRDLEEALQNNEPKDEPASRLFYQLVNRLRNLDRQAVKDELAKETINMQNLYREYKGIEDSIRDEISGIDTRLRYLKEREGFLKEQELLPPEPPARTFMPPPVAQQTPPPVAPKPARPAAAAASSLTQASAASVGQRVDCGLRFTMESAGQQGEHKFFKLQLPPKQQRSKFLQEAIGRLGSNLDTGDVYLSRLTVKGKKVDFSGFQTAEQLNNYMSQEPGSNINLELQKMKEAVRRVDEKKDGGFRDQSYKTKVSTEYEIIGTLALKIPEVQKGIEH